MENFAPTLQFEISLAQLCRNLEERTSYDTVVGSKAATVINNLTKIRSSWVSRINWQLTFSPGTGLYEISIRLNRSMWRERRRLDVTVPNSGKLEIYLSNLPPARFSSSATLVPWQFFIIRKWVVILMRQILNAVQDVGPGSLGAIPPLNAPAYSVQGIILKLSFRIEK